MDFLITFIWAFVFIAYLMILFSIFTACYATNMYTVAQRLKGYSFSSFPGCEAAVTTN